MVEVRYSGGRKEAERINARLKQSNCLKPSAQVETNPTRTITTVYYGASQAKSPAHEGYDEVAAAVAAKGGVR